MPVLILALTSDTMPLHEVNDFAATVIVQKLSQVSGVGAVTRRGRADARRAARRPNPAQLAGLGLSLEDVRRAIAASTVDNPKGQLDGARQAFQIGANDQLLHRRDLRQRGDRLSQRRAGAAARRRPRRSTASRMPSWPAGTTASRRSSSTSSASPAPTPSRWSTPCEALLPKLRATLPPALKISVVTDRTTTIRAAIADVQFTLGADRGAGRPGDLPVPAQAVGDGHSRASRCRCR